MAQDIAHNSEDPSHPVAMRRPVVGRPKDKRLPAAVVGFALLGGELLGRCRQREQQ